jgi:hypothetical protein
MKHIISFSGGMGSFAEAVSCVNKYGKDNVTTLFSDTLIEDYDLYRFMDDCVAFLECEHIVIKEGRTPFQVFKDVKYMGNTRIDPCSKILKRDFLNNFIKKNWNPKDIEVHLGIDYSEGHRLSRVQDKMHPYVYRSTLVEDGKIIAKDFSVQFGIEPPRLYKLGLGHNNCGGFCVKAGLGHYKKLLEGDRDQYISFERKEADVYTSTPSTLPFLRKRSGGVVRYLTLKEYREALEQNPNYISENEKQEFGGCGCAL